MKVAVDKAQAAQQVGAVVGLARCCDHAFYSLVRPWSMSISTRRTLRGLPFSREHSKRFAHFLTHTYLASIRAHYLARWTLTPTESSTRFLYCDVWLMIPSAVHTYCVCVCNAGRAYRFHGQRFATAEPKGTRSTDCARALNCCPVHDSGRQSQGNRSKAGGVSRNQAVRHRRRRAIAGAFRFRMCTSDS